MEHNLRLDQYQLEINQILYDTMNEYLIVSPQLKTTISYTLEGKGKRLRPILFVLLLKAYGIEFHNYTQIICAIEMIHNYSLVHDDLPAMDNDSLRHGQPTLHVEYGEAIAILTGDALLTDAFYLLSNTNADPNIVLDIIRTLSYCSGSNGMIHGQVLDMINEVSDDILLDSIEKTYHYKTALLLQASISCACIIANKELDDMVLLGSYLGQAFQIQDDLIEKSQSIEIMGKSKTDEINNKQTIVSIIGIEKAKILVTSYYDKIDDILNKNNLKNSEFAQLIKYMQNRIH